MLDNNVVFFLIGACIFSPLLLFRCGFIKVTILIFAYPVWIISGLWLGMPVTRIISSVGYNYYYSELLGGFLSALGAYVAFLFAIFPLRKESYCFNGFSISLIQKYVISIMLLAFLCIAYPKAFFLGDSRFGSMGGVSVILFSFLMVTMEKKRIDLMAYFAILIYTYMIIRGERVDFILGLITFYFFYRKSSEIAFGKLAVIFSALLLLGVYSGLNRAGGDVTINDVFNVTLSSITNFGTAIDVIHVFLSSVWYYENIGSDIRPVLNVLFSYIPLAPMRGAGAEYNYVWILREYIFNVGGGLFYSAPMMLCGLIGVVVSGFLYGFLFKYLYRREGLLKVTFIVFFIMQFRVQWYGMTYFGSALIFMLLLYLFFLFLLKVDIIRLKRKL
ncbi:hypothetical protein ACET76_05595 [Aeromonas caviae]|uniref:hypothetical protein n=1 Tax=Aeromonas caviae TaxID=648 RepID=UPI0038D0E060